MRLRRFDERPPPTARGPARRALRRGRLRKRQRMRELRPGNDVSQQTLLRRSRCPADSLQGRTPLQARKTADFPVRDRGFRRFRPKPSARTPLLQRTAAPGKNLEKGMRRSRKRRCRTGEEDASRDDSSASNDASRKGLSPWRERRSANAPKLHLHDDGIKGIGKMLSLPAEPEVRLKALAKATCESEHVADSRSLGIPAGAADRAPAANVALRR